MSRPMTFRMAQALRDRYPLCLLAVLDHPSGLFRAWTGIGSLEYDGETWLGLGLLGQISPVKSVTDLSIQEVRFTLSGVDAATLALLDPSVRRRPAQAWLAARDPQTDRIVADPFRLLDCEMDTQEFAVGEDGMATITIIARSGFYSLERSVDEVWSDQDQQRRFPGDTGLSHLATLQNQDVIWTST